MATKRILARKVPATQKAITDTYHGNHPNGGKRVIREGRNAIFFGEVFKLTPTRLVEGEQRYSKKSIEVTKDYVKNEVDEVKFTAKGNKSQNLYGFVGQLKYCLTTKQAPVKPAEIDPSVEASVPVPPVESTQQPELKEESIAPPDLKLTKEQKKLELRALEEQKFYSLLNTVQAQLAAGQDPLVPISYFSRVSKRSRATLYREQGTVIPKFIKISKSSFLLHSDLENYMAGRPAALRNQSESKHSSTTVGLVQKAA